MIPTRKKTPEELAALREGLGVFPNQNPEVPTAPPATEPASPPATTQSSPPASTQDSPPVSPPSSSPFKKVIGQAPLPTAPAAQAPPPREPIPPPKPKKRRIQTLRKFELPLAPGYEIPDKTAIPRSRRSAADLAEMQRREALANFTANPQDAIAHLKKLTAHPVLLTFTYLLSFAAIYAAWNTVHFVTPISLISVSGLLTAYIFWKKKRSRHHAAILMIILVMTLVFGGIHYAPYFSYAS